MVRGGSAKPAGFFQKKTRAGPARPPGPHLPQLHLGQALARHDGVARDLGEDLLQIPGIGPTRHHRGHGAMAHSSLRGEAGGRPGRGRRRGDPRVSRDPRPERPERDPRVCPRVWWLRSGDKVKKEIWKTHKKMGKLKESSGSFDKSNVLERGWRNHLLTQLF